MYNADRAKFEPDYHAVQEKIEHLTGEARDVVLELALDSALSDFYANTGQFGPLARDEMNTYFTKRISENYSRLKELNVDIEPEEIISYGLFSGVPREIIRLPFTANSRAHKFDPTNILGNQVKKRKLTRPKNPISTGLAALL